MTASNATSKVAQYRIPSEHICQSPAHAISALRRPVKGPKGLDLQLDFNVMVATVARDLTHCASKQMSMRRQEVPHADKKEKTA
jgi:hypothetical protein